MSTKSKSLFLDGMFYFYMTSSIQVYVEKSHESTYCHHATDSSRQLESLIIVPLISFEVPLTLYTKYETIYHVIPL